MANFLAKQAEAHAAGIANFDGEVMPYEVGPVQPLDPKLAWDEALVAVTDGKSTPRRKAPPHWAQLVAGHESMVAIPLCAGNFPQLMRDFRTILAQANLSDLRPTGGRPVAVEELAPWADEVSSKKQFPEMLWALGALRLAKQFDKANQYAQANDASIPAEWRNTWENEKAALLWHQGRCDEARATWDALEATIPVLFNRGMAALFANDKTVAKQHLTAAVAKLPVSGAWHHLGRLYLTLVDLAR